MPNQIVTIAQGCLEGQVQELGQGSRVASFLGIPYAAPPVGERRWRAPGPAPSWEGVRRADTWGDVCPQNIFPPNVLPEMPASMSEDCLTLNVWKPASAGADSGLPVMVWIHGGGYVSGGSANPAYSGHAFARDGVVLVSINYRIARFGFFVHPALADEGFGGNFGFLDQIAALEWVRDNIAAFGGDPARVTVFGESAGGGSVHMLLQSPRARGLFAGAIVQSGGGRNTMLPPSSKAKAAATGEAFAPGASAQDLRAMPVADIVGDLSMTKMISDSYCGPVLDGETLIGEPLAAARNGLYPDVPVLLGANSADGFPTGEDKDTLFARFGAVQDEARRLYDPAGDKSALEIGTQMSADHLFREPARAVARTLAARGGQVWLYRFAHVGVTSGLAMGGVPHAAEIPYVFDVPEARLQQIDTGHDAAVAALTHRYWVNFAKTGCPDGAGEVPAWTRVTGESDTCVQLIESMGARHAEDPLTATLDFRERQLRG
ncbi:carboxylesterase/lipase family protein [Novosphingobium profundi]|uniref:carboxylesterase/lipase family protein n=1 Tax=Novosphingobium profundi TaxID=1774954 RepID=UPI001CFD0A4F|nr:carboxylesterase family protein [Novosphingobium profundi]